MMSEVVRETSIIWRAELSRALRSSRWLVLFLLYAVFTAMALLIVVGIARSVHTSMSSAAEGIDPDKVREAADATHRKLVETFFSNDPSLTDALLTLPLVLLVVFKTTLRFLPLFIGIMGFDIISGEIGPRSIRYLTVRARRSSVLFGKVLAQATLLALLMLVIDTALCGHARFSEEDFTTAHALGTLARFWLSSLAFALPYLALTGLCSTLFRQGSVSLVVNLLMLFGVWLLALIGEYFPLEGDPTLVAGVSPLAYLRYGSVWHYASQLLNPDPARFGPAVLAHLGFFALFMTLAWAVLRRRDV